MKKILLIGILLITLSGCTENERTRNFGGTQTVKLDKGWKVENVTWKDESLWILVRPSREGEKPETHTFFEQSSYGIAQGKVLVVEQ